MFVDNQHSKAYQHWSDEQLITAFQQSGDAAYFSALFGRYTHLVYLNCCNYFPEGEDCRDIVMQVFAKVYRLLPEAAIESFPKWLHTLTRNECIDALRTSRRNQRQYERWADLEKSEEDVMENEALRRLLYQGELETVRQVEEALMSLGKEQRICLQLFYYEEKSYREIALLTSYTEKQVKSYLQNGKRKLKLALSGVWPARR